MTNRAQDFVLGATLVVLAAIWTWLVIDTIPPGFGDGEIGARAFPLAFGVILLALAALLLLRLLMAPAGSGDGAIDGDVQAATRIYWGAALLLLVEIALYGFLLEKIGFVLATPIIVLLVMTLNLRVRSIPKLAATSLGLTVGCWVIFEKVLGIYLANGTWMNVG